MAAVCRVCGASNPIDARLCSTCQAPLPTVEAERKLVTVLFADVVGATGLGEQLDVEPLREVFELFFSAMRSEAEQLEGVSQFIGDAVMAVFGIPATHEDDADRALTAAVNMLDRLEAINARTEDVYGAHVALRIGVNTGEILLPAGSGVSLGRLTGDTLNVAARLQGEARPGSILVAERSVRSSRRYRFEDRGMVDIRGRVAPVHAYELRAPRTSPRRTTPLLHAPLVGRDATIDALAAHWRRVADTRAPSLVTVVGEAGIGKSRLVSEFLDSVEAQHSAVLEGRCMAFGEELTFQPLAELWRREIGALESDAADTVRAKIAKVVRELSGPHEEVDRVISGIELTLDVSEPAEHPQEVVPRAIESDIRAAWRFVFGRLAQHRDLVVVIEDLHWADPRMIRLLSDLAQTVTGPLLILCTTRPSLFETTSDPPIGEAITLDALDEEAAATLLDQLLGETAAGERLRTAVLSRAEGNPLFIEEILHHMIDEGRLKPHSLGWRMETDVDAFEIPDTIQAVLAGRIDLLAPDEKLALQCAAVIGRIFWLGAVAALLGRPIQQVEGLLETLAEKDLIRARSSSLADQREYLFKHVLARDVAYGSLPRKLRSQLHDGVADWIAAGPAASRLDLHAHHSVRSYEEAQSVLSLSEAKTEALRSRAFDSLLRASDASRTRNAIEAARSHAERAAALAKSTADQSRAEEALGEAAYFLYEGDKAWRHFRRAVDLRVESKAASPKELARLCGRALNTPVRWPGTMQHHPPETLVFDYLTRAFEWAGRDDSAELARLLQIQSFWRHAYPSDDPLISTAATLEAGKRSVAMARRLERPDIESAALDGLSANYIPDSNYAQAWLATSRRMELAPEIRDPEELGDIHAMHGWECFHRGRYREAHDAADRGYRLTVDEEPSVALHCLAWRGMASFPLGRWDDVLADLAEAQQLLGDRPDPPYYASGLWALAATVHDLRGASRSADAILDLLIASEEVDGSDGGLPLSHWAEFLGPLLARRGEVDRALRLIRETEFRRGTRRGLLYQAQAAILVEAERWDPAAGLAGEIRVFGSAMGLEALAPWADRLEGIAFLAKQRLPEASRNLAAALSGFEALAMRFDAACTRLDLASVRRASGHEYEHLRSAARDELLALGVDDVPDGVRLP